MDIVLQITAFLITVLVLVSIHEAGHFWVARWLNIKVLRFSIGFGKPIWQRQAKNGIEYSIGILPLGGYVKLLDEREGVVEEREKPFAFNRQSLWKRFLVVAAGPVTNIVFAILAFWLMYGIGFETMRPVVGKVLPDSPVAIAGLPENVEIAAIDGKPVKNWQDIALTVIKRMGGTGTMTITTAQDKNFVVDVDRWQVNDLNPEPLRSLGLLPYSPTVKPLLDAVEADSPAEKAGLKPGDTIIAIDNKAIDNWSELAYFFQKNPDTTVNLTIERDAKQLTLPVTIGSKFVLSGWRHIGRVGVSVKPPEMPDELKMQMDYSFAGAFVKGIEETFSFFSFNFVVLKKMSYGEISLRSLGGPITIFKTADRAFKQGFIAFLSFLALISVMLAFVNVLPVPGLDGGHLLYFLIEFILRRPLSIAAEVLTMRIGMVMLLLLMLAATMNDILRIFL